MAQVEFRVEWLTPVRVLSVKERKFAAQRKADAMNAEYDHRMRQADAERYAQWLECRHCQNWDSRRRGRLARKA